MKKWKFFQIDVSTRNSKRSRECLIYHQEGRQDLNQRILEQDCHSSKDCPIITTFLWPKTQICGKVWVNFWEENLNINATARDFKKCHVGIPKTNFTSPIIFFVVKNYGKKTILSISGLLCSQRFVENWMRQLRNFRKKTPKIFPCVLEK